MNSFIDIQEYTYDLPTERIALHPLVHRDESNLLVYKKGNITHSTFKSIADFLPDHTLLVFNDTKVIPARILFTKDTGAEIEIFLLNPLKPSAVMADVMNTKGSCTWQCTIGNLKRWKENQLLTKQINGTALIATLLDRKEGIVELQWNGNHTFAEVVTLAGITPLPPYIKRDALLDDVNRYQTIYSHYDGAVAAPTAGLHFTESVFESFYKKRIDKDFVTLHVSAGTFQPVKAENALDHAMHHEQIIINRKTIEKLLQTDQTVIAVGTTSMRTLESLYWFGAKLIENPKSEFIITQTDPYTRASCPSAKESLKSILEYMDGLGLDSINGSTSIFIYPSYAFKICKGLVTNFHLPASTLMLLVAALVGEDWKKIYQQALEKKYRFLSYGDSSLLLPD